MFLKRDATINLIIDLLTGTARDFFIPKKRQVLRNSLKKLWL